MARPKKKDIERMDKTVQIRMTQNEFEELETLAEKAGMTVSKFLRANIRSWLR
nr:ribbon-helix-helix protein, CopG family [uncultured Desulfuromonas sp.]